MLARRGGEVSARYGGEEFALLLPGSDGAAAEQLAQRLRNAVEKLALPHAKSAHGIVTASIGVATFVAHDMQDGAALTAASDAALYRAKGGGRNRVELAA